MGSHCLEESRALIYYLYDQGFRLLNVSGISLGGCIANMINANVRVPVASVSFFCSLQIGDFWMDGALKNNCNFK